MSTKDDPRHTKSLFKTGDKVMVFDADDWMPKGDIGDNSCFYKPATVLKVRKTKEFPNEWLADVRFDYGHESKGHFQSGIKLLKTE